MSFGTLVLGCILKHSVPGAAQSCGDLEKARIAKWRLRAWFGHTNFVFMRDNSIIIFCNMGFHILATQKIFYVNLGGPNGVWGLLVCFRPKMGYLGKTLLKINVC